MSTPSSSTATSNPLTQINTDHTWIRDLSRAMRDDGRDAAFSACSCAPVHTERDYPGTFSSIVAQAIEMDASRALYGIMDAIDMRLLAMPTVARSTVRRSLMNLQPFDMAIENMCSSAIYHVLTKHASIFCANGTAGIEQALEKLAHEAFRRNDTEAKLFCCEHFGVPPIAMVGLIDTDENAPEHKDEDFDLSREEEVSCDDDDVPDAYDLDFIVPDSDASAAGHGLGSTWLTSTAAVVAAARAAADAGTDDMSYEPSAEEEDDEVEQEGVASDDDDDDDYVVNSDVAEDPGDCPGFTFAESSGIHRSLRSTTTSRKRKRSPVSTQSTAKRPRTRTHTLVQDLPVRPPATPPMTEGLGVEDDIEDVSVIDVLDEDDIEDVSDDEVIIDVLDTDDIEEWSEDESSINVLD